MSVKLSFSTEKNIDSMIDHFRSEFIDFDPKLVLFFSSDCFDGNVLNTKLKGLFTNSCLIGCTTAGEIISGKMLKNSVVVMAFDSETISDVKAVAIENISKEIDTQKLESEFSNYFGESLSTMDYKKYGGLILIDGMSLKEEDVLDKVGDISNILFVGGSSGDDLKFKETKIFLNGETYTDACLMAVFTSPKQFSIIKTQSFNVTNKKLIATKVNEKTREVIEFNNQPAAKEYANQLGVNISELQDHFTHNPVGLVLNGEIFVRSPQKIEGNSVFFYCNLKEGMETFILESGDIIKDTERTISEKITESGNISALVNFNCLFRTLELEKDKKTEEYGSIFKDIPTIGFSTYGEAYIGHMNQTATMLAFN